MNNYKYKYRKYKTKYLQLMNKKQIGGNNLCRNGCGRKKFQKFFTCCSACKSSNGPHTNDCNTRNPSNPSNQSTVIKSKTFVLQIYGANGNMNKHITIAKINHANPDQVFNDVVNNFKQYFGRQNQYTLKFNPTMWGKNSILISSNRKSDNTDLDSIRHKIITFIVNNYGNILDKSRYISTGIPPQHIDVKSDKSFINKQYDVTYAMNMM
jgi:hypothetical protein